MRINLFFVATLFQLGLSTLAFSQESNLKEDYSAYLPEAGAVNRVISKLPLSTILTSEGLENSRKQQKASEPKSTVLKPVEKFSKGPGGNIRMVIFRPDTIRAVVLNIHGGGWIQGRPGKRCHDQRRNGKNLPCCGSKPRLSARS